jgi:hypothetical protein
VRTFAVPLHFGSGYKSGYSGMNVPDLLRQKVPDLTESAYTTLTVRAADKWPQNGVQAAVKP